MPGPGDVLELIRRHGALTRGDVLDITGTWKFKERPFDPKSKEMLLDDWRVIWVIVEEKDETHHFRLSGPEQTVNAHAKDFEKWIKSLK